MTQYKGGWVLAAAVAALMLVSGGSVAEAQDREPQQPRVFDLGTEELTGRHHKPEAFYILQHANLNFERLDPKATFLPELVKSVEEKPF